MDQLAANLTIDVSAGRYGVVAVAVLAAGVTDVLWLRISNALTFPLIVSGILYHAVFPAGGGLLFTLAGACCGFVILLLPFARGGVGAGDVKLLTGIGAWIGAHDVLVVFIVAALLNGVYSLAMIARTNAWKDVFRRFGDIFRPAKDRQSGSVEHIAGQDDRTRRARLVPMGAMIACAVLLLLIHDFLRSPRAVVESGATQDMPSAATRG